MRFIKSICDINSLEGREFPRGRAAGSAVKSRVTSRAPESQRRRTETVRCLLASFGLWGDVNSDTLDGEKQSRMAQANGSRRSSFSPSDPRDSPIAS